MSARLKILVFLILAQALLLCHAKLNTTTTVDPTKSDINETTTQPSSTDPPTTYTPITISPETPEPKSTPDIFENLQQIFSAPGPIIILAVVTIVLLLMSSFSSIVLHLVLNKCKKKSKKAKTTEENSKPIVVVVENPKEVVKSKPKSVSKPPLTKVSPKKQRKKTSVPIPPAIIEPEDEESVPGDPSDKPSNKKKPPAASVKQNASSDVFPPENFKQKGPLVIPKSANFLGKNNLDEKSVHETDPNEHFKFDEKMNVSYDMGSDVEILKSRSLKSAEPPESLKSEHSSKKGKKAEDANKAVVTRRKPSDKSEKDAEKPANKVKQKSDELSEVAANSKEEEDSIPKTAWENDFKLS